MVRVNKTEKSNAGIVVLLKARSCQKLYEHVMLQKCV